MQMNEQQANEFLAANRGLKEAIISALQGRNPAYGLSKLRLGTSILSILNKMETGRAETEYDMGRTSIGAYATGLDLWNKEISDIAFVNTRGNDNIPEEHRHRSTGEQAWRFCLRHGHRIASLRF